MKTKLSAFTLEKTAEAMEYYSEVRSRGMIIIAMQDEEMDPESGPRVEWWMES
jgi:hypothetical protein